MNQIKTTWNTEDLEYLVKELYGKKYYYKKIREPLNAFEWKIKLGYYHACESESSIREFMSSSETTEKDENEIIAKAILITASSDIDKFPLFRAEANIIASAQATHSLFDILANIIYWGLELKIKPQESIKKLNLFKVDALISKFGRYSKISTTLRALTSSDEFSYIVGYVNTTKHKSLIEASLTADFEKNSAGYFIKEFEYEGYKEKVYKFSAKKVHDFLFIDQQALRIKLLSVGNSLNEYLSNQLISKAAQLPLEKNSVIIDNITETDLQAKRIRIKVENKYLFPSEKRGIPANFQLNFKVENQTFIARYSIGSKDGRSRSGVLSLGSNVYDNVLEIAQGSFLKIIKTSEEHYTIEKIKVF